MKQILFCLIMLVLAIGCTTSNDQRLFSDDPVPVIPKKETTLFNGKNYDGWDLWMQASDVSKPASEVFTVQDGAMHITGEGFGGCTTQKAYKDYHLTMEFRYVDDAYASRKGRAADGGLLFHCVGPEGVYGGIWHLSFECNIIQGRCCDLIVVGNKKDYPDILHAKAHVDDLGRWEPDESKGKVLSLTDEGRVNSVTYDGTWQDEETQPIVRPEKPYGEWNTLELICEGSTAEYILNGKTMLKLFDLNPSAGRIQLQSECHAIEYRNIKIAPIRKKGAR